MAKKKSDPPKAEYIQQLATELERMYALEDKQIDDMRKVRTLSQSVVLPEKYKLVDIEIRDPVITDEIQRVVAAMTVNQPRLACTPASASQDAQDNATIREKFWKEVIKVSSRRIPGLDHWYNAVDSIVADGAAWVKFVFSKDIWDERYGIKIKDFEDDEDEDGYVVKTKEKKMNEDAEDAKKRLGPPFNFVCCDVRSIYPVFTGGKLMEMVEVYERPLLTAMRHDKIGVGSSGELVPAELGQEMNAKDKERFVGSTVKIIEHWDDTYVTYLAVANNFYNGSGGKPVQLKQWAHRYGRVPYFPAMGVWQNQFRNRKTGWGIAQSKIWHVMYRSWLWTLLAQIAARDTLPPLFKEIPQNSLSTVGDDGSVQQEEYWRPGEIIQGRPGEKLVPFQFPPIAPSLQEQLQIINGIIDNLLTPKIKSEIGSGPELSGYAIAEMLTEARLKFDPITDALMRMMMDITEFGESLVRNVVKESIWVYSEGGNAFVSLAPNDTKKPVIRQWYLDVEKPSAEMVQARYYHERLQAGTLNMDTAIDRMGDNPDEIRRGKAIDELRQSPEYKQYITQLVWQEAGMGDVASQAQKLAETGGAAGGGQAPPTDMAAMMQGGGGGGAPPPPQQGIAPPNGSVAGAGPGAVVPQQGAEASTMNMGDTA
jgi:hypothetical protein